MEPQEVNFQELRDDVGQAVEKSIQKIDKSQSQRRDHVNNELENVEFLKTENSTIQKQLVTNLVTKNCINDEAEEENNTFLDNFDEHVHKKQALYNQLFEIEYIMRLLKIQVSDNQTTGEMVKLVNEAQDDIMKMKNQEENKIVNMVSDDVKSQADSLARQVKMLQDQMDRQNSIEANLESFWEQSCQQMQSEHDRVKEEREKLIANLADLRKQVQVKQASRDAATDKSMFLEAEVARLRAHSVQLQENLEDMVKNYDSQFELCISMISRNNDELTELREANGRAVADFFDMSVQNEALEMRVLQEKGQRELNIDLNYQFQVDQMKADTLDAMRKAHENQQQCDQLINHWKHKVTQMEYHVSMVQSQTNEKVLSELVEHYMTQIDESNAKLIEMRKQKVQIQAKLREPIADQNLDDMQKELDLLISEYNNIINEKIKTINELFGKLEESCKKDDDAIQQMIDLYNLKNAIDIAQKDMQQKQAVQIEQETEAEELRTKNAELDQEIDQYQSVALQELREKLKERDDTVDDLHDQIRGQETMMHELQQEYQDKLAKKAAAEAEVQRMIEEQKEKDRLEREAALAKKMKRVWYEPIKGDRVDEMMAKYLNECQYYVPVKRLGDGQYLYGQKKIYAKILNDKLVIRVGGGYELITKFLSMYAEEESKAYMQTLNNTPTAAQGSPKRARGTNNMKSPPRNSKK